MTATPSRATPVAADVSGAAVRTPPIIERDRELTAIERFVGGITDGPGALVVQGPPGIGKSTLLAAGIEGARRFECRILEARPTEAEADFAFAALDDLVRPAFAQHRAELPAPQERHLGAALLLVEHPGALDPRAVATATLTLFELLASEQPLVIAIDDVQWLDPASAGVLAFLIRRLAGPVRWLLSSRDQAGGRLPLGLDRASSILAEVIVPSPLSLAGVQRLVMSQGAAALPRPALARVFATSGGNPYFAIELARVLQHSPKLSHPHEPLPLPAALHDVVIARIEALSTPAREAALLVAVSLDPSFASVTAAMTRPGDASSALAEAEAAEVLIRDGHRLAFAHPLLASGVFDSSTPTERRDAHRRLAGIVANAEERAVHLARTVDGVDDEVARQIEDGAREAASRGAQAAAAELFEAAGRATPPRDRDGLARCSIGAAAALLATGAFTAARRAAEQASAAAQAATDRAEALQLMATMDWYEGMPDAATRRIDQALAEVGADDDSAARIYARFVRFTFSHDVVKAVEYADAAIERLDARRHPVALGHVLIDRQFAGALHGEAVDTTLLARGMALEQAGLDGLTDGPQPMPLIWFHCVDDYEAARRRYDWESDWYRERGNDVMQADRASHLAVAELRAGHAAEAARLAAESCAVIDDLDVLGPLALVYEKRALADAFRGDVDSARATLLPLIERFEHAGQSWWAALALSTLAFTEFAAGDLVAALRLLERMRQHADAIGVRDILFDRSEPHEIDARVQQGDLRRARAALERLIRRDNNLPRSWTAATIPACRALIASADGDERAALAAFDQPMRPSAPPFEAAWAHLVEGRVRRRARQKRAAAEALRAAERGFEAIGASPWAERARRELARVGLRHAAADALTASERRIAELAAAGLTNREIAAAAFLSAKTVEANLARAYGKLGVRSRAELGARMATQTRDPAPET